MHQQRSARPRSGIRAWPALPALCLAALLAAPSLSAADKRGAAPPKLEQSTPAAPRKVSLVLRDADLNEAMAMIAKAEGVNILLAKGVEGEVNVNLRNVGMEEAIEAIAGAAGFAVERRDGAYLVVKREEVGKYVQSGLTRLRTFKVQYAKAESLEGIVKNHLSAYGKVTKLAERKLLVVEDTPEFLDRISALMRELDRQPKQILIEAKILKITLDDNESFGLDWNKMFKLGGDRFSFGVTNLSKPDRGLDFHLVNSVNSDFVLNALRERGRVRTLSSPKLLALEDQQAETIIGARTGYKTTTLLNTISQENIQFLESGVILRVTPSVDNANRILLAIHPEVSRTTVNEESGIPSLATTEVTTNMLVEDGQTVLIAGLIDQETNETRDGVPVLGDIPVVGRLFSSQSSKVNRTETIVFITPRIVSDPATLYDEALQTRAADAEQGINRAVNASDKGIRLLMDRGGSASLTESVSE